MKRTPEAGHFPKHRRTGRRTGRNASDSPDRSAGSASKPGVPGRFNFGKTGVSPPENLRSGPKRRYPDSAVKTISRTLNRIVNQRLNLIAKKIGRPAPWLPGQTLKQPEPDGRTRPLRRGCSNPGHGNGCRKHPPDIRPWKRPSTRPGRPLKTPVRRHPTGPSPLPKQSTLPGRTAFWKTRTFRTLPMSGHPKKPRDLP